MVETYRSSTTCSPTVGFHHVRVLPARVVSQLIQLVSMSPVFTPGRQPRNRVCAARHLFRRLSAAGLLRKRRDNRISGRSPTVGFHHVRVLPARVVSQLIQLVSMSPVFTRHNLETAFALPAIYSDAFPPPDYSENGATTVFQDGGWFLRGCRPGSAAQPARRR
jgi:hypothetical protein